MTPHLTSKFLANVTILFKINFRAGGVAKHKLRVLKINQAAQADKIAPILLKILNAKWKITSRVQQVRPINGPIIYSRERLSQNFISKKCHMSFHFYIGICICIYEIAKPRSLAAPIRASRRIKVGARRDYFTKSGARNSAVVAEKGRTTRNFYPNRR